MAEPSGKFCVYCELMQPVEGSLHLEDCPYHNSAECIACEMEKKEAADGD